MSWLSASGGQSIGASASASDLPMQIQSWFFLGLTGLIALLSKGLSRVFSSTTVRKHQTFCKKAAKRWPSSSHQHQAFCWGSGDTHLVSSVAHGCHHSQSKLWTWGFQRLQSGWCSLDLVLCVSIMQKFPKVSGILRSFSLSKSWDWFSLVISMKLGRDSLYPGALNSFSWNLTMHCFPLKEIQLCIEVSP